IKEEHSECIEQAEGEWKCCYHFTDFRLYSRMISYGEMNTELSNFKPDAYKVVHLISEDYTRLLSLTAKP
ncbi:MAG: hypothetical protein ACP5OE_10050, partial [Thermodesulfobium sp.]